MEAHLALGAAPVGETWLSSRNSQATFRTWPSVSAMTPDPELASYHVAPESSGAANGKNRKLAREASASKYDQNSVIDIDLYVDGEEHEPIRVSAMLDLESDVRVISNEFAKSSGLIMQSDSAKPRERRGPHGHLFSPTREVRIHWGPAESQKALKESFYIESFPDSAADIILGRYNADINGMFIDVEVEVNKLMSRNKAKGR